MMMQKKSNAKSLNTPPPASPAKQSSASSNPSPSPSLSPSSSSSLSSSSSSYSSVRPGGGIAQLADKIQYYANSMNSFLTKAAQAQAQQQVISAAGGTNVNKSTIGILLEINSGLEQIRDFLISQQQQQQQQQKESNISVSKLVECASIVEAVVLSNLNNFASFAAELLTNSVCGTLSLCYSILPMSRSKQSIAKIIAIFQQANIPKKLAAAASGSASNSAISSTQISISSAASNSSLSSFSPELTSMNSAIATSSTSISGASDIDTKTLIIWFEPKKQKEE